MRSISQHKHPLPAILIINPFTLQNQSLPTIKDTFTQDPFITKDVAASRLPKKPTEYRKFHAPIKGRVHRTGIDSEVRLKPNIKWTRQKTIQVNWIHYLLPQLASWPTTSKDMIQILRLL
ncbi:hypothetical protein V6N11_062935 [Hibiscus sabdariffa]|uniref:Uncharacterized protein n=2 Tax=Hibiscus sabdariffa TaxID=183260 RepID=A0ABR2A8E3_9ROSI